MKHVVLLIIPNLGGGGAQKVFHQHLRYFRAKYETIACVFNMDGALENDRSAGIVSLEIPAGSNWLTKVWNFSRRVRALRALKKKHKVSLTISHLEGADYVNLLSGTGDRRILWIHGSKRHDELIRGPLGVLRQRVLIPFLYRKAHAIACVSNALEKELVDVYGLQRSKITAIHNGVDLNKIRRRAGELPDIRITNHMEGKFVIVTHCRMAEQKNLEALLALAASLRDLRHVVWLVIGDGNLRNSLLDRCRSLGLSVNSAWTKELDGAHVYFPGYLNNPYPYLRMSQLYVMTSLWEGFPLALCEAMACGVPVMAADCPTGPAEILNADESKDNLCGYLMPMIHADNIDEVGVWEKIIREIVAQPGSLQLYAAAGSRRVEHYSLASMESELGQLVNGIS